MGVEVIYLTVGILSTMWLEQLLVDQRYGTELGVALSFGDRLKSIVLWPVFTLPYLCEYVLVFIQTLVFKNDQQ